MSARPRQETAPDGGEAPAGRADAVLRRAEAELRSLEPRDARRLACLACVLARVAHADLRIDPTETAEMRRRVASLTGVTEEQAGRVVEIAQRESGALDAAERRAVTAAYRALAGPAERTDLVFCLYVLAGADGRVDDRETAEIDAIADELGVARRPTPPPRDPRPGGPFLD